MNNAVLGILLHWMGGFVAASFYVPYKRVRGWSWEVFWIVGATFSWIATPWIFASVRTNELATVLSQTPPRTLLLCYGFGFLWGFGGITYSYSVEYLGISLGTAMVLGFAAALGTLIPPLVDGRFFGALIHSWSGIVTLAGVCVCLLGIGLAGRAGQIREDETTPSASALSGKFRRGLLVAAFSGVMSSCFAYGLAAGEPIRRLALTHGTEPISQGLPVLIVVLLGGYSNNLLYCAFLMSRNGSAPQMFATEGGYKSLFRNYWLCALGGVLWYLQFFFYTMGETKMGKFQFSSWSLHMGSIVLFASLWGVVLSEWKSSSVRARRFLTLGLATLLGSMVIIGFGNYLNL